MTLLKRVVHPSSYSNADIIPKFNLVGVGVLKMGIFDRFKKSSFGAPLNISCARCGMKLHGGTGAILMGTLSDDVIELISRRASICRSCQQPYCPECCYQAGKRKGRSAACPRCGGEVG
jgi:hypothetical protein